MTYEELRGMTQEDLVRLVLELQEEIETYKEKEYGRKEHLCEDCRYPEGDQGNHQE
jgi:hypothetical protein